MGVVQVFIPRAAGDAVDVCSLRDHARAAGIVGARAEISRRVRGRPTYYLVTCRTPIAEVLAADLRRAIETVRDPSVRQSCELGLAAVLEGIADAYEPHSFGGV